MFEVNAAIKEGQRNQRESVSITKPYGYSVA
jgi:hypothetical protein